MTCDPRCPLSGPYNSRYQAIVTIETQERTDRKGLALDVNDPEARKELGEVHEVADALIPFLFGDLPLVWKRPNYVALSACANGCFGSRVLVGEWLPAVPKRRRGRT